MGDDFAHPEFLVSTEWLATRLGDPKLRVIDCTVHLEPRPEGGNLVRSGRADFEAAHIPGADFIELATEVSDSAAKYYFMVPPAVQFADAMARHGIGDQTKVVAYATANHWWATRLWWLLRVFGHERVAVLDGGFQKWRAEGRAVETGPARAAPPGRFRFRPPRLDLIASKADVQKAIGDARVCTINALRPEQHAGTGGAHYGRPGHIAGSINVPALHMTDPATNRFKPPSELRALLGAALAKPEAITYCGGGIAASSVAMVLTMLGHPNVRLYDASLSEWARDPTLPMEVG